MLRRTFLRRAGSALTFGLLGGCSAAVERPGPSRQQKVLILGAGIAGLAAARVLHDAGFQVQILEGRQRIGGRIWTSHAWQDVPLDLGASWIHGTEGNPIAQIAAARGIRTAPTDYDNGDTYAIDGTRVDDRELARLERQFRRMQRRITRSAPPPATLQDAIESDAEWQALAESEQAALLHLFHVNVEHELAGSLAELSAQNPDDSEGFAGGDVLFPGGYEQIWRAVAEGLDVRLAQLVQHVAVRQHGVTVATDEREFHADRLIVTLPIGVLKAGRVTFDPPLPASKQHAIDATGSGLLDKLYLRFDQPFWDTSLEVLDRISRRHGRWNEWLNLQPHTREPVLLGFNAADYARLSARKSDEELVADAMAVLRTIHGPSAPDPIAWQRSNWSTDPFALGSYSFNTVGANRRTRRELGRPVGDRLFFAGEATSQDYPSTVHGAYLSGKRAADEVRRSD